MALTGRATKWCDEHRPDRSNRKRVAEAHARAGDTERARRVLEAGRTSSGGASDASGWDALLYAAALTCTDDRLRAARVAGVEYTDELDAQARAEWADLIEQRAEGMQRLIYIAMTQSLARLTASVPSLPVGQLGSTLKAVVEAAERLQTAIKPTFGDVQVVLDTAPLEDR